MLDFNQQLQNHAKLTQTSNIWCISWWAIQRAGIHLTLDLAGNTKFGPDVEWLTLEGQQEIDSSIYAVEEKRQEHFVERIASYLPLIHENKNR